MIINVDNSEILKNKNLNNLFFSASLNDIDQECKILKGDFYLDSFNYINI